MSNSIIVKCIIKENWNITVGSLYEVTYCTPYAYMVVDDLNITAVIDRHLFEDITELRNKKLKELGI